MAAVLEQRPSWADWETLSVEDRRWLLHDYEQTGGPERQKADLAQRAIEAHQPPERRFQCEHASPAGRRCPRRTVPNSTTCWRHSSALAQQELVQAVSDARCSMVDAANDAVATLVSLMDAMDESVRLRASTAILDRLGLTVTQRFEGQVNHTVDQGSVERAIDDRITELLLERQNNAALLPAPEAGIVNTTATPAVKDGGQEHA